MNKILYGFVACFLCLACGNKKRELKDTSQYFPILSYLQSQVKDIDTSLYSIIKIETVDGKADTTYIERETVKNYAKDFLHIPDITNPEFGSDYTETSYYDSLQGTVSMSYTAYNAGIEVPRQDVTILPTFGGNDQVRTVYIEKIIDNNDSTIEKKMLWEVKKYFNIRTIVQKKNGAEKIYNLKVEWKDFQQN